MSRLLLTIAVEDAAAGALGAKEAAAMALEKLGGVRVLRVDVREPEQMRLGWMEHRPSHLGKPEEV